MLKIILKIVEGVQRTNLSSRDVKSIIQTISYLKKQTSYFLNSPTHRTKPSNVSVSDANNAILTLIDIAQ